MGRVEERREEVKRLRCSTCSYEITSSWFFLSSQRALSVLKPADGHLECCVGAKISPFTTVDGSRSIPVSTCFSFWNHMSVVSKSNDAATGGGRRCYDKMIHGHRSIIGGKYTPNVLLRRMTGVEERPAAVKRLRCITCKYEITSSWFRVDRQGISKVLKPSGGHFACRVGWKIGPFTTVDGSSSITDTIRWA